MGGAAVECIRSLQTMLDNARAAWPDLDDIAHGVAHVTTQGKLGLFVFSAREEIRPPGLRGRYRRRMPLRFRPLVRARIWRHMRRIDSQRNEPAVDSAG